MEIGGVDGMPDHMNDMVWYAVGHQTTLAPSTGGMNATTLGRISANFIRIQILAAKTKFCDGKGQRGQRWVCFQIQGGINLIERIGTLNLIRSLDDFQISIAKTGRIFTISPVRHDEWHIGMGNFSQTLPAPMQKLELIDERV